MKLTEVQCLNILGNRADKSICPACFGKKAGGNVRTCKKCRSEYQIITNHFGSQYTMFIAFKRALLLNGLEIDFTAMASAVHLEHVKERAATWWRRGG